MKQKDIETQARFWKQVNVISHATTDSCWEWQGAQNGRGYGVASIGNGETQLAHRFVASLTFDITDQQVLHRCDNPLCVRPSHLWIGSQQDNMHDMYKKNRANNKLSIEQVRDIRTKQLSRKEYATKYNISEYHIGAIQRRDVWEWLD